MKNLKREEAAVMAELTRIGDILGQQAPETSSRREALRDSGGFVTPHGFEKARRAIWERG